MYKELSKHYDIFMQDVNYQKWFDYICSFLTNYKSGVDMACGTGRFTIELSKHFEVYGVDISPQMLNMAINNAKIAGKSINFVQGDINNFSFIKSPDFVTIMCDGINYIKEPLNAFQNIYNSLISGGTLVFDISSEYKLKEILANNTYSETQKDITYIWRNFLNDKKNCVDMELTFFSRAENTDLYEKSTEHQTQYIHSCDDIISKLKQVGFDKVHAYGDFTKKSPAPKSMRIHFVCRK